MSRIAKHKANIRQHYYRVMPNRKRHRILVWVAFLVVAIAIGLQMAYPLGQAVPFARLGNQHVGWQSELALGGLIGTEFEKTKIRLEAGKKTTGEVSLASTGAEPETAAMAARLVDYPFWQRFIPGSILWQQPRVSSWQLSWSDRRLSEFAAATSKELSFPATNAKLEIKDGRLIATDDTSGADTSAPAVRTAIQHEVIAYGTKPTIQVASHELPSLTRAADLSEVRQQAEAALALPVSIEANGKLFTPSATDKASWLQLTDDEKGKTTLSLNLDALSGYLDNLSKQAGAAAGRTNVTIKNGHEIAREVGQPGTKINNQPMIALIDTYLLRRQGRPPFIAEMVAVPPTVVYNNTYTATQDGLRAYISEKAKHGAWISIRQLDGERWLADADATDSVVSGSTYKLYVSLYLFKEMDEGKRAWGTPILDTDTTTCFNRMTIASTNPCAEEWLRQFGRNTVNEYLYSRGFSRATTFTNPEATHTSALDLTTYMIGLEQGTLVSGGYRDRLLYSLSHHPYRYGIPTGSKGQVWDKVGFIWDYVNDTAIVHHPRGTYVMTIMTKGQSYAAIANMTRDIERLMYP